MELVKNADALVTQDGIHRLVINLVSHDVDDVEVRNCEVIGARHRNRYTFPMRVSLDDVFVDHVAAGLRDCLSSLSNTTEVVSLPSVSIEIPGLTLAMPQLVTTMTENNGLNIIMRFKMLLGSISHGFRDTMGVEGAVTDHSAHLSALVLSDLVMPLLDMCTTAELGRLEGADRFDKFIDTLLECSHEMRFQAELIKRFVSNAEDVRSQPPGRGLQQPIAPTLVSNRRS